jgi:hypothetical protein
MNCEESKELMVAYIEDLLDAEKKQLVAEHLRDCVSCRAELKEISNLRDRLVKNGKVLARGDIENVVLDRIIREQNVKIKTAAKISTSQKIRRIIMKSPITKLAAAAVIVIAVIAGVSQFFGGTVTFAEVIKPILNARTVVFDFIAGEDENGPVIHDIVVDSRIRRTFSNMDTILILDLDNAKMLTLEPKTKGAMYVDIQGPLKEQTKNFLEFVRGIVARLKDLPVEELGKQQINGREAVGFLVRGQNEEITIWADPTIAKPVRIELLLGKSLTILKNIKFDAPIDESLISMEPPADYTLASMEYNMGNFCEQDFVESLRIWAEILRNGSFPEVLSVEECLKVTPQLDEKLGQSNLSQEEGTRLGMTFGRGFIFFQQLTVSNSNWHYAGNGVKLGEAEKAIFWYQPKEAETYRVIYGDLHVEDVAPENLPK